MSIEDYIKSCFDKAFERMLDLEPIFMNYVMGTSYKNEAESKRAYIEKMKLKYPNIDFSKYEST